MAPIVQRLAASESKNNGRPSFGTTRKIDAQKIFLAGVFPVFTKLTFAESSWPSTMGMSLKSGELPYTHARCSARIAIFVVIAESRIEFHWKKAAMQ